MQNKHTHFIEVWRGYHFHVAIVKPIEMLNIALDTTKWIGGKTIAVWKVKLKEVPNA